MKLSIKIAISSFTSDNDDDGDTIRNDPIGCEECEPKREVSMNKESDPMVFSKP